MHPVLAHHAIKMIDQNRTLYLAEAECVRRIQGFDLATTADQQEAHTFVKPRTRLACLIAWFTGRVARPVEIGNEVISASA